MHWISLNYSSINSFFSHSHLNFKSASCGVWPMQLNCNLHCKSWNHELKSSYLYSCMIHYSIKHYFPKQQVFLFLFFLANLVFPLEWMWSASIHRDFSLPLGHFVFLLYAPLNCKLHLGLNLQLSLPSQGLAC